MASILIRLVLNVPHWLMRGRNGNMKRTCKAGPKTCTKRTHWRHALSVGMANLMSLSNDWSQEYSFGMKWPLHLWLVSLGVFGYFWSWARRSPLIVCRQTRWFGYDWRASEGSATFRLVKPCLVMNPCDPLSPSGRQYIYSAGPVRASGTRHKDLFLNGRQNSLSKTKSGTGHGAAISWRPSFHDP